MKTARSLLLALSMLLPAAAHAELSQPALLVASKEMSGPYARTVLFAMPARDGGHFGFVLNRPTDVRIAALPSPVFAGGPEHAHALFAFVRAPSVPAEHALRILPDLYLAYRESDVEQVLERLPRRTRLFAGMVTWPAGALDDEVGDGAWHVLDADVELVLEGSIDTLWGRLIARAQTMTASAGAFRRVAAGGERGVAPDVLLRTVSEEVLAELRKAPADPARIAAIVETRMLPHFDARRATQIAVGAYWRQASPAQQERLVREFTTLLVRTYSGALASYRDQRIEFTPLRAKALEGEVTVRSVVRQPGAEPIAIEYDLERTGDAWKVFDVRVAGISLVATYRSSFAETARNHGIEGLLELLERRNQKFPAALRM